MSIVITCVTPVSAASQTSEASAKSISVRGDWVYLRVFVDSVLLSACTSAGNLLLGYPLAYALVRSRTSLLKSTILITTIVPMFTGDIVRT